MNGTMMDIVEDHEYGGNTSTSNGGSTTSNNKNNNTRRRRGTGTSSSSSSNGLDFSDTVESILATLEKRGDNHDPHHGPLNRTEMSKLSMLCSQQQQQQQQQTIKANGNNDKTRTGGQVVLNEDLGFADVDVELVGELVEFLEKHVALASNINIIQSSNDIAKKIKAKGARYSNFDEVRCDKTKTLVDFTDQSLKYV
jgi:hypothetical protein